MAEHQLSMGAAELDILMRGSMEYAPPEQILGGLSAADACRRVVVHSGPGDDAPAQHAPHTIAELVWHLNYWQQYQLAVARGGDPAMPDGFKLGESDFSAVAEGEWDALRAEYLASYAQLTEAAADPEVQRREVTAKYNLGFMLANHALHNAYHLGQVMQLRRIMGNWPGMQ